MNTLIVILICTSGIFMSDIQVQASELIPRKVGPISLGMTTAEFEKITGVVPGLCPGECVEDEKYASLQAFDLRKLPKIPSDINGIEVFFWKGKLYYIITNTRPTNIINLKQKLTNKYGLNTRIIHDTPQVSMMLWADNKTEFYLVYGEKDKTVFSYRYKDKVFYHGGASY